MFAGPDPALRSILNGILAVAAACYGIGAVAVVIGVRAEPERARWYARLAAIAKVGPPLVGLACLGFMMDAIDLRPGHEADLMGRWPALLPQVAALSAGAAFLAGLLAGSHPVTTAFATGGPMALLSALVWAVAGVVLAAGWREDAETVRAGLLEAPADLVSFFKYVTLFPLAAIALSGATASVGRTIHRFLGLPGDARTGSGTASGSDVAAAGARLPAPPPPTPLAQAPPAPRAPGSDAAGRFPPLAWPRPGITSAKWPGFLLIAIGALMLLPAGCDLLTPKAHLVTARPAGGADLPAPPSEVALTFDDELSPSSRIVVRRTVTLHEGGGQLPTGGTPVADASGSSVLSRDRRTLSLRLPDGLPGGLYLVDWTVVRARDGAERFGSLYFGVKMSVPSSIPNRGAPDERDPHERDRREALAGGVIAILLGTALRVYAGAARM